MALIDSGGAAAMHRDDDLPPSFFRDINPPPEKVKKTSEVTVRFSVAETHDGVPCDCIERLGRLHHRSQRLQQGEDVPFQPPGIAVTHGHVASVRSLVREDHECDHASPSVGAWLRPTLFWWAARSTGSASGKVGPQTPTLSAGE